MKLEASEETFDGLYRDAKPGPLSPCSAQSPFADRSGAGADTNGDDTKRVKKVDERAQPSLIWHLREASAEAMRTFVPLDECTYQNKSLGASRQLEDSMVCDCSWDPAFPEDACGENCINRLTQVECVAGECRCRSHCRNQRFQRKQYASLDIVLTERKGYGVRAARDITSDTFIYEYIGEVIPHNTFLRRIREYANEGIEHFYFMMLQKDEYIDATRKGDVGRFLNHSCRPNCYVAKWVVGKKMRMGIFAKRKIAAGEELTFNYNVDRYGHDAQECFCGESNCVGFIGGKTQTDIGAMDDLYLEALGITDDVEAFGLKGSKRKKGRKLDEDYNPVLRPIELHEAPKVASAIRQAVSIKRILTKLLSRVQLTTEPIVQRQMLRLHGISLMGNVLLEYETDVELIVPVIEILLGWPLMTRNKLVSSNIEPLIEKFTLNEEEAIAVRAQELLKFWATLELGYRIPKAVQDAVDASVLSEKRKTEELFETLAFKRARLDDEVHAQEVAQDLDAPRFQAAAATVVEDVPQELPTSWKRTRSESGVVYYYNETTSQTSWVFPSAEIVSQMQTEWKAKQQAKLDALDVNDILGRARLEAEQREADRLAQEAAYAEDRARRKAAASALARQKEESRRKAKAAKLDKRKHRSSAHKPKKQKDPAVEKEKALMRAFGGVVVATMSRYKTQLDVDQFKRRAKEITHLLAEKEKKSSSFEKETYASLSKDKTTKVRKFVDDYVQKLLSRKPSSSKDSPSKSTVNGVTPADLPPSPTKGADAEPSAEEQAMVRELAGDEEDNEATDEEEEDIASSDEHQHNSDGETPDRDTPGSTPSNGGTTKAIPPPPNGLPPVLEHQSAIVDQSTAAALAPVIPS